MVQLVAHGDAANRQRLLETPAIGRALAAMLLGEDLLDQVQPEYGASKTVTAEYGAFKTVNVAH